jgi:hypothetical protein
MSWEQVRVHKSSRRRKDITYSPTNQPERPREKFEEDTRRFLESYKTKACQIMEFHDYRLCRDYHSVDDQRRNPYNEFLSPDDEEVFMNQVEKMYHPTIYRTSFCHNIEHCFFGPLCAHAHFKKHLRDRDAALIAYESSFLSSARPLPTLSQAYSQAIPRVTDVDRRAREIWKQACIRPSKKFLPLSSHLWFVVRMSNELVLRMEESAFESGLGTVKQVTHVSPEGQRRYGMLIVGMDVQDIAVRIRSLLDEPSPYFATRSKTYGQRVIARLKNLDKHQISSSENLLIEFVDDEQLRLTAVASTGRTNVKAESLLQIATDKIDFWIGQEGYNAFWMLLFRP